MLAFDADGLIAPTRAGPPAGARPASEIGLAEILDPIDRQIIGALEADPYSTNRALGQGLSVPELEIAKRIRRMDEQDIMRLSAAVDIMHAGYKALAHIYLRCQAGAEDSLATSLLASTLSERILSIHSIVGKPGLEVTLRMVDNGDLIDLMTRELPLLKAIEASEVNIAYDILYFRTGMMAPNQGARTSVPVLANYLRVNILAGDLDELDALIIAELQMDGRQSSREIGRRHSVTEGTIRYRLRKLDDLALMRIAPVQHPSVFGVRLFARIQLQVSASLLNAVYESLRTPHLLYAALTTGVANLHVVVSAASREEIHRITASTRALEGVRGASVMILKQVYLYDTRWHVWDRSQAPKMVSSPADGVGSTGDLEARA